MFAETCDLIYSLDWANWIHSFTRSSVFVLHLHITEYTAGCELGSTSITGPLPCPHSVQPSFQLGADGQNLQLGICKAALPSWRSLGWAPVWAPALQTGTLPAVVCMRGRPTVSFLPCRHHRGGRERTMSFSLSVKRGTHLSTNSLNFKIIVWQHLQTGCYSKSQIHNATIPPHQQITLLQNRLMLLLPYGRWAGRIVQHLGVTKIHMYERKHMKGGP